MLDGRCNTSSLGRAVLSHRDNYPFLCPSWDSGVERRQWMFRKQDKKELFGFKRVHVCGSAGNNKQRKHQNTALAAFLHSGDL